MADFVSPIIGVIGGFFLGWFSHRLTRSRDAETRRLDAEAAKRQRKLNFLGFLARWKAELRTEHSDNFIHRYSGHVALLRVEALAVKDDFIASGEEGFDTLVLDLSSLQNAQINRHPSKSPRDVIGESLDALIEFVERN
jgi:hypothetical protein